MVTKEKANKLLAKSIKMIEELGYKSNMEIDRELRFYPAISYFGKIKKMTDENNNRYYKISLSTYHLENGEKAVLKTLLHEVIHTLDNCFNHGSKFQEVAKKANKVYETNIGTYGSISDGETLNKYNKNKYKYIVKCKNCGQTIKRKVKSKLIKNLSHYCCSSCGGDFERIK